MSYYARRTMNEASTTIIDHPSVDTAATTTTTTDTEIIIKFTLPDPSTYAESSASIVGSSFSRVGSSIITISSSPSLSDGYDRPIEYEFSTNQHNSYYYLNSTHRFNLHLSLDDFNSSTLPIIRHLADVDYC